MKVYYEKLGHMLKPLMPKFRSDLSARLRYIAERQVPAKLKPIVVFYVPWPRKRKCAVRWAANRYHIYGI